MPNYQNINDLITRYGIDEIASLGDRGVPRLVDAVVLNNYVANGNQSGNLEPDVAAALVLTIEKINGAITDAAAVIDGYLTKRYVVPIVNPPPVLSRICGDIARYYLSSDNATELVTDRYNAAINQLKDMASGKFDLPVTTAVHGGNDNIANAPPSSPSQSSIVVQSSQAIFKRGDF